MDFDDIKRKMDADKMDDMPLPTNIKQLEDSKIPIQAVRKSMKGEIITQVLIIGLFFAAPSLLPMDQLPKGVYYILQLITSLITLLYLAKMTWFLNRTSNLLGNSKDTVVAFIHDLKITMEVYKTAVISGSLILPVSMITLLLGIGKSQNGLFLKLISLDMRPTYLMITIGSYLVAAAVIYYITIKWAEKLYGVHIEKLENTLKEFEND